MNILVKWTDLYSVGVGEIDEEHKHFFEIINMLYDAFIEKDQEEKIVEIVNELTNYTETHFKTEESFFAKFNYSDSADHISEHRYFIKQIEIFRSEVRVNPKALTPKIMFYLKDWLSNHILVSDKKYESCFHQNGLS